MALNNLGLGFVFTAKDLASGKISGLERRFRSLDDTVGSRGKKIGGAFRELGAGLTIFTAGAVGVGATFALANKAGPFEQGLAGIGAVTRATAGELDMLHDSAIRAGIATQFSPDEAVAGLTSLATAGQTARQATETLIPVLDLAAGSLGQLSVAEGAEAVVGTLNAYGKAANEAGDVTDRLLRITQLSNFQARDFSTGLAKAAASGSVFNQSLDDVLITMGLLRNRNIDASSSATAYRESVRRLGADQGAQKAIAKAGVKIFDEQTGKMRSMVDIMSELAVATESMTDKERNRIVVQGFGARGLLAFQAVQKAQTTIMRDGREVTLKGAEAISYLREQMEGASGTAAEFREKLLDTFEGQKTLLRGSMQTLGVILGEQFARIFKPVVTAIIDTVNSLIDRFQKMSPTMKAFISKAFLVASSITAILGAAMALKGAFSLLRIGLSAIGLGAGGLTALFGPFLLTIAAVAAAVYGLKLAFDKNLGGIADWARNTWARVKLFFQGLVQLFSQGGFSGAVRDELDKAENQGIKSFLIGIYKFAHRLQVLWEGLQAGFAHALEVARPAFDAMAKALGRLWDAASRLFSALFGWADDSSSKFGDVGVSIGEILGGALEWVAHIVEWVAAAFEGFFDGIMDFIGPIKEAFGALFDEIGRLFSAIGELFGMAGDESSSFADILRGVGQVLGWIAGAVVTGVTRALEVVVLVIRKVVEWFKAFGEAIGEGAAMIVLFFTEDIPNAISAVWETIKGWWTEVVGFFQRIGQWFLDLFSDIADGIKALFQPVVDFFAGIAQAIEDAINSVIDTLIEIARALPDWMLPESLEKWVSTLETSDEAQGRVFREQRAPAVAAFRASEAANPEVQSLVAVEEQGGTLGALATMRIEMLQAMKEGAAQRPKDPVQVNATFEVDGQKLGEAVARSDQESANRGFSPVPTY